jgi:glycosyltransferase involved in cell wall biosynthesis
MACGTPVVISSAVPEEVIIDGYNGIRVNSYNPIDYANALERLLEDEKLWLRLS